MQRPPSCDICNCDDFVLKVRTHRVLAVCKECGRLLCQVQTQQQLRDYQTIEESNANSRLEFIIDVQAEPGHQRCTCGACGALLYDSKFPTCEGHFNLMYAKYCPKCGAKFFNGDPVESDASHVLGRMYEGKKK